MKILFSPSKGMTYKKSSYTTKESIFFTSKTTKILNALKKLSIDDIQILFKIKGKLLEETYFNIQNYETLKNENAICLYDGVTFKQLDINNYTLEDFKYIEDNLLIFSAFYGIVKGTTNIKPYRLDMTIKVLEDSSYKFWENEINNFLDKDEIYLNLASKEFSKIVDTKNINMITVEFRQEVNGVLKNISTEAKKARGSFLNFIIKNKLENIDDIKKIELSSYRYNETLSNNNTIFFVK